MYLKMSSAKWRPFCLGLNVLIQSTKHSQGVLMPCLDTGDMITENVNIFVCFPDQI